MPRPTPILLASILASVVGASCGVTHPTLDARSVSSQISAQLTARYQLAAPPSVACPSGVADKKGQTFTCTASLGGHVLHLDATVTGGGGHFTVAPKEAIIAVPQRVTQLTQQIDAQAHTKGAKVDCGSNAILVVEVGHTFPCTVTFSGQSPRQVTVKVVDQAGDFGYTVAPVR